MSRISGSNGSGSQQPPNVGGPQVPLQPQGYPPTQMAQGPVPPVPQQPPHGRGAHANFGYARPLTPESAAPLARIFAGRQVDINQFSDLPHLLRSVDGRALGVAVTLDELAKRLASAGLALTFPLNAPPDMRAGMLKPLLKGSSISVKEAIAALATLQQQRCVVYSGDPATDARQSIGRLLYATMGREPAQPAERQALCERLVFCIESASNGAELISLAKTARQTREPRRPTPQQPAPAPLRHPVGLAPNARGPSGPPPLNDSPPPPQDPWADFGSVVAENIDRQVFEDVAVLMHAMNARAAQNGDSPQLVDGIPQERIDAAFERLRDAVPPELMNRQEGATDGAYARTLMKAYLEAEGVNSVDLRANGPGSTALSDQFLDFVSAKDPRVLLGLSSHVHRRAKRE